jgi:hypothetical protein
MTKRRCDIPAKTLPPCDLEWGHDGTMHANAGDGFYAREYEEEHRRRQREREPRIAVKVNTPKCCTDAYRTLTLDAAHARMNAELLEEDRARVRAVLDELDRLIALNASVLATTR